MLKLLKRQASSLRDDQQASDDDGDDELCEDARVVRGGRFKAPQFNREEEGRHII